MLSTSNRLGANDDFDRAPRDRKNRKLPLEFSTSRGLVRPADLQIACCMTEKLHGVLLYCESFIVVSVDDHESFGSFNSSSNNFGGPSSILRRPETLWYACQAVSKTKGHTHIHRRKHIHVVPFIIILCSKSSILFCSLEFLRID